MGITPPQITLTPEESAAAEKYFALCDGQASGYRLAMEQAKKMFLEYLMSQRKQEIPAQPEPPKE